ncbi:MAG: hypothetical protein GYA52_03920 [Chloroflexi bacterium]|nr:hypothetical protein [Chloroflexota bacterium]
MSATERKEKMADLRIENTELRQANNVLTKINAVLLHEVEEKDEKLERLGNFLENVSMWMYKQQGNPLPQWADEFQTVCQIMEPKQPR